MRKLHLAAQDGEHRFGDNTALVVAELRMRAEKAAGGRVGWAAEA
jgi:hypothetical protein